MTLALGVAPDEGVAAEVLVVAVVGEQMPGETRIECPPATAAFCLPMRRASRQQLGGQVGVAAAGGGQAHSISTSPSQRLPLVGLPGLRESGRPADARR